MKSLNFCHKIIYPYIECITKINRFIKISKQDTLGTILIIFSFTYFILFIYFPMNEKYSWMYPLGWDAPSYIFSARLIEHIGYFQVITDLEPHGSHLILYIFRCLTGDYAIAWHIISLLSLFLAMVGIAMLFKECYIGGSLWGFIAGAFLPYLSTTYYMFGGLFRQLIFFSLYPFGILLTLKYLKRYSFKNLLYIIGIAFLEWWIWPWGFPLYLIILILTVLLTYKTPMFFKTILITIIAIVLYSTWYIFYLQSYYSRWGIPTQLVPEGVTRGISFTFKEYLLMVANDSLIILLMFISSISIEMLNMLRKILILSPKTDNKIIFIAKVRNRDVNRCFLLLVTFVVSIIASPFFPYDEAARRLTPFLLQSFWITFLIYFIWQTLKKKYMKTLTVVLILAFVSLQLNPYNALIAKHREIWWRIWYFGNIEEFLNLLNKAYLEYSDLNMHPVLIIVPSRNIPMPEVTTCLYLKSFFIYSIFINAKNYTDLKSKILLGNNITYIHPFCAMDFEKFIRYEKRVLYLRPFFAPDTTSPCYTKFSKDGYCIEKINE